MNCPDTDLWPSFRDELRHLLIASRDRIAHCLDQLSTAQVWWRPGPHQNSIGNLMLHLDGNLRQWGICGLTDAVDSRNRDEEFARTGGIPARDLLSSLSATVEEVCEILRMIDPTTLSANTTIQGFCVSRLGALMHTVPHFVGHTHQITQLTRLQLGVNYRMQWSPDHPRGRVPL